MYRKSLALTVLLAVIAVGWADQAAATTRLSAGVIKAALRTADPEEDGFVERVVDLALQGTLPPSLVDSTFQWARTKPKHKFQYFKRALLVRAARLGIDL